MQVASLGEGALAQMTILFDPLKGGEVCNSPLAQWLLALLESKGIK